LKNKQIIGDKAYYSRKIKKMLRKNYCKSVIPPKSNSLEKIEIDTEAYKTRNCVERFFYTIKQLRRIATRYDKSSDSLL
jgi:transposase